MRSGARWITAELASAANVEREDLKGLEAGRPGAPDDLLLALSATLGIESDMLGGRLDTADALAALPSDCALRR